MHVTNFFTGVLVNSLYFFYNILPLVPRNKKRKLSHLTLHFYLNLILLHRTYEFSLQRARSNKLTLCISCHGEMGEQLPQLGILENEAINGKILLVVDWKSLIKFLLRKKKIVLNRFEN